MDEDSLIGAGGSSKVYKVPLSDDLIVAVKKLWNLQKEEGSLDHGSGTELKTLANIQHRHIVKLLCSYLLVYEYMPNGSLRDLCADTLPWEMRYKIAVGVPRFDTVVCLSCLETENLTAQFSNVWTRGSCTWAENDHVIWRLLHLQGLEYLHHHCSPQILHRDIKSNNILVDLEYEAKLANFGIAKSVRPAASHH